MIHQPGELAAAYLADDRPAFRAAIRAFATAGRREAESDDSFFRRVMRALGRNGGGFGG